jgi:hypothetical protein
MSNAEKQRRFEELTGVQKECVKALGNIDVFSLKHYRPLIKGECLFDSDHIMVTRKGGCVTIWYDDAVDGNKTKWIRFSEVDAQVIAQKILGIRWA